MLLHTRDSTAGYSRKAHLSHNSVDHHIPSQFVWFLSQHGQSQKNDSQVTKTILANAPLLYAVLTALGVHGHPGPFSD